MNEIIIIILTTILYLAMVIMTQLGLTLSLIVSMILEPFNDQKGVEDEQRKTD